MSTLLDMLQLAQEAVKTLNSDDAKELAKAKRKLNALLKATERRAKVKKRTAQGKKVKGHKHAKKAEKLREKGRVAIQSAKDYHLRELVKNGCPYWIIKAVLGGNRTKKVIFRYVTKKGHPEAHVRVNLNRLLRKGRLILNDGVYRLPRKPRDPGGYYVKGSTTQVIMECLSDKKMYTMDEIFAYVGTASKERKTYNSVYIALHRLVSNKKILKSSLGHRKVFQLV